MCLLYELALHLSNGALLSTSKMLLIAVLAPVISDTASMSEHWMRDMIQVHHFKTLDLLLFWTLQSPTIIHIVVAHELGWPSRFLINSCRRKNMCWATIRCSSNIIMCYLESDFTNRVSKGSLKHYLLQVFSCREWMRDWQHSSTTTSWSVNLTSLKGSADQSIYLGPQYLQSYPVSAGLWFSSIHKHCNQPFCINLELQTPLLIFLFNWDQSGSEN